MDVATNPSCTQDVVALLDLPSDIWTHILDGIVVHDAVILQSTNRRLFKLCNDKFDSIAPNDDSMLYFADMGAISCMKYCHDISIEWDEATITAAAKQGQLEAIKFLHQNGCDKDTSACEEAAANGHLECLKYMHENGFPWDESATEAAVYRSGSKNLEILKFLRDNGCPWRPNILAESAYGSLDCLKYVLDNIESDTIDSVRNTLCSSAAQGNNLEALKYLHEAGFPIDGSCAEAARGGSLECLKYAHEHGDEWGYTLLNAAHGGHADCLEYALQNGDSGLVDKPDLWHVNAAVSSGNVECVKLLLEHGGQWHPLECDVGDEYNTAAMHNRLDMVKYMLEVANRPKPTTNRACMEACGNLSLLKYLHENGFSWDGNEEPWADDFEEEVWPLRTIIYQAIEYKSLPCLKYILECGYKVDTNDMSLCNAAARKNDVEILKYLISLGCTYNNLMTLTAAQPHIILLGDKHSSIMDVAARYGSIEVIKYLHKSGTDLHEGVATSAARWGQARVLEYALKHGYGINSDLPLLAASGSHLKCLKVAHKYGVPFTADTMRKASKSYGNRLECLKYLHESGCEWSHQECTNVVKRRDPASLKYLHEHGSQWNEQTWYAAVDNDDIECLEYLFANGCPQDHQTLDMAHQVNCFAFMQQHNIVPNTNGGGK